MKKDVLKFVLLLIFIFLTSLISIVQVQADEDDIKISEIDISEVIGGMMSEGSDGKFVEKIEKAPIVCIAYGTDYLQESQGTKGPPLLLRQSTPSSRISTRTLVSFSLLTSAVFLLIIFLLIRKVRTLDMFVLEYKPRPRKK